MKPLVILICAVLLAGCESRAERAARYAAEDHEQCITLGFIAGTKDYANCRMQMLSIREQKRANAAARYNNAIQMHRSMQDTFQAPPTSTGICTKQGSIVVCN